MAGLPLCGNSVHRAETPALPKQDRYVLRLRNVKVVTLYLVWMLSLNNLTYWNFWEMPLFPYVVEVNSLERVLQYCHNCFNLKIPADSLSWKVCLFLLLSSTLLACVLVHVTLYVHVGEDVVQIWHCFYAKPSGFLQTTNSEL